MQTRNATSFLPLHACEIGEVIEDLSYISVQVISPRSGHHSVSPPLTVSLGKWWKIWGRDMECLYMWATIIVSNSSSEQIPSHQ